MSRPRVTLIDCELGNVGSIRNMLHKVGASCDVASTEAQVFAAERLILPGVGKFDHGMAQLAATGLIPAIRHAAIDLRRPLLGICLGMQLLTRGSEEGELRGLGLVAADTLRFDAPASGSVLKVPHMGWNRARPRIEARLFKGLDPADTRFYFVHSYFVRCDSEADAAAVTSYGVEFHSAIECGNIFGVQFHPEKSHRFGMQLLQNFVEI